MQNIIISTYGLKLYRQRYGKLYHEELQRLSNRDISDISILKDIQNRRFLELFNYALKYCPFYKEFYKNVDLSRIKSVDDIHLLPILTKEVLRKNMQDIYTTEKVPFTYSMTGGTTGKSLGVKSTINDIQIRAAYLDWFKSLYGFKMLKDKHARFNGKDIIPYNNRKHVYWRDN